MLIVVTPAPLYHAVPHPDGNNRYQVIEGHHCGAPVVANCPNQIYAEAIAQALNDKRECLTRHGAAVIVSPSPNYVSPN